MSSTLYSYRNLIYTYSRRLNVNRPLFSKIVNNNTRAFSISRKSKSEPISINNQRFGAKRHLSVQPNPDNESKRPYVPLMEFPELIWPKMFQMARCWFNLQLNVIPLDAEFNILDFMAGTRHAVCTVSDALSTEDYDSLSDLVTPEVIEVVKRNLSRMSDEQKREISLKEREYFFSFPGDVSVRKVAGKSSKIVEILMVYHFLRDWKDPQLYTQMMERNFTMQRFDFMTATVDHENYAKHAIIGNYRFIRELGGDDSSWSINLVNQFRLSAVQ